MVISDKVIYSKLNHIYNIALKEVLPVLSVFSLIVHT